MDSRGYLRITGRLKDMVIRGGMNIYPREIEEALFAHPKVADVSVIGLPDERWGEIVAAVVRPRSGRAALGGRTACLVPREARLPQDAVRLVFRRQLSDDRLRQIQKFMLKQWAEEGRLRAGARQEAVREARSA